MTLTEASQTLLPIILAVSALGVIGWLSGALPWRAYNHFVRFRDGLGRDWGSLSGLALGAVVVLGFVWLSLFLATVAASLTGVLAFWADSTKGGLGLGAIVAGLLGAPFLIWTTIIKHRTLGFQKEGHITDRISKAVEQLGAEKKIDRIGRPVTILTGGANTFDLRIDDPDNWEMPKRSIELGRRGDTGDVDGKIRSRLVVKIRQWNSKRTEIEWQGQTLAVDDEERRDAVGDWTPFSETVPNIEVRIGGILSLERIAQDSCEYDRGRDHVRLMEILCAYVRENSPAKDLEPTPNLTTFKRPRLDIQTALNVLKRRSARQIEIEHSVRYRMDLRGVDFDGCDLSNGNFSAATMTESRFEGANFSASDLTGVRMHRSLLNFSVFLKSMLRGTDLSSCTINQPSLNLLLLARIEAVFIEGCDMPNLTIISRVADGFFGSSDTRIHPDQEQQMRIGLRFAEDRFLNEGELRLSADEPTLEEIGTEARRFLHWSPFPDSDNITHKFRQRFAERKGLTGWPFTD